MTSTRTALLLSLTLTLALGACASAPAREATHERPVAALELVDMDGGRHDVQALLASGRLVTLVFWQTWCASCLAETPRLIEASREHAGRIEFFGVVSGSDGTVDDAEVRSLTGRLGTPYPQVRDRDASLSERFEVTGTPTLVVLGPSGRIVYRGHRLPDFAELARDVR
jgi:thiol-disulfide isomerase/thioredoxin